jgi:hypothetical protein
MEPLTLRALERIVGVLIGGFAIYLGYQLFVQLPTQMNSEGKFVLPGNISIYLSRVGPGVFFALFGTLVVAASFYFQLKIISPASGAQSLSPQDVSSGSIAVSYLAATEGISDRQALESARSRVLTDIRTLNQLHNHLTVDAKRDTVGIKEDERTDIMVTIPRLKLTMLFTVWDKDWGDYAQFAKWVKTGAAGSPPQGTEKAAALFLGK